jgi:hypothetical protein
MAVTIGSPCSVCCVEEEPIAVVRERGRLLSVGKDSVAAGCAMSVPRQQCLKEVASENRKLMVVQHSL